MKTTLERILVILNWIYAILICIWLALRCITGDSIWWLSLVNHFAPWLFVPLIPLAMLGMFVRQRGYILALVPPLLIFLLLYGVLFLPAWSRQADGTSLTVMTFNVWGFSETPDTAQAILQDGTPDIVLLQEVSDAFADVLLAELGDIYPYRLFKLAERADSGLAILSRYPLEHLTSDKLSDWRILVGRVDTGNHNVVVYNIHPTVSNLLIYLEEDTGLAESIKQSTRTREAEIREVLADIAAHNDAVIVAGDMNSTDQSTAYKLLARQLTDAHRAAGWGFGHTFPAYAGSWRGIPIVARQLRLDMIWYSDAFVATESHVGAQYGESDHRAVIAELSWQECRED